ncbi:MAG: tRNA guanosine(34) transglycosylase Tgt [Rhodospirillales bacterium]|nr:tRNA guanosine(34) transglycosylase Tgt [Rhodospirillales bacterium]
MTLGFTVEATDGHARLGRLETAHGPVHTPSFMPVGTQAAVKGLTVDAVRASGARIVLGNTYHLMIRPGAERIARLGGLHEFMNWPGPILTDSGGFQVMSLAKLRTVQEDGVVFRAHTDGTRHHLTPLRAVAIQHDLDSDITMVLDECSPYPASEAEAAEAMRRSMRWAALCKDAFVPRPGYGLFGIVQGGIFPELRAESAAALTEIGFDGYAVGGLAVGEGQTQMLAVLDGLEGALPAARPRYLMGVGTPDDIVQSVRRGIDLFDCVLPTRSGRTARAYTSSGTLNMRNARHAEDPSPVDAACACPTCADYSRAYLHHLFRTGEMLGPILLTQHNLYFYQRLMADLRAAISKGRLDAYAYTVAREQAGEAGDPA